ncbi:hypothetical protein [Nocardioides sp. ChNu-99]|uniref:tetratricopeptide repeat protein n=1 Tax=Nocardioides sp. ChNu-99 TaxID=2839897 RepID=UPI002405E2B6|nr:hypothetical protein [Nocardioides sp. ChNu-99]MDF9717486.1 hypothetical protein [Nocardioides sp. ChNu-99]
MWAAYEAGDVSRAEEIAEQLVAGSPDDHDTWFQTGLLAKVEGRWELCAERSERAVPLLTPRGRRSYRGEHPSAWNAGIAATVLERWADARRAWDVAGVGVDLGEGDGPIEADLGLAPVRLNPEERPPTAPGGGASAVVWTRRLSPAHGRVVSIPFAETGHRYGDLVAHDGAPSGTRTLDGRKVPVFDALRLIEASTTPAWEVSVEGAGPADVEALADAVLDAGLGFDDWGGVRVLCAECSAGDPDRRGSHRHEDPPAGSGRLVIAGERDVATALTAAWSEQRPHVVAGPPEPIRD